MLKSIKEINRKLYEEKLLTTEKKLAKISKAIESNDERMAKLKVDYETTREQLDELRKLEHNYR